MRYTFLLLFVVCSFCMNAQSKKMWNYYKKNNKVNSTSKSVGTVSNGKLINGVLIPPGGKNFSFFSKTSYLNHRGYVHSGVKKIFLSAFDSLYTVDSTKKYVVMETCKKHGGKMWPHRTHQNGTSVDLMIPLKKRGKPYLKLNNLGLNHYFLEFNNIGQYSKDKSVSVDFDELAKMILVLNHYSKKHKKPIKKVIMKTEWKPLIYKSKYGKQLKKSGIYFVKWLTPKVNAAHDDHVHIDFK